MRRAGLGLLFLGAATLVAATQAEAQSARRGAVVGGATGAVVGGIAGGGRGALIGTAIGAGTGAVFGDMQRRRGNRYWYNGRCWQRSSRGEFFPVANRYCR